MYIRRGADGVEVGMCSGVCGPFKAHIEEMQAEIGESNPRLSGELEQLKTRATELEQRVERGEVTRNQMEREIADLAARLRLAAEEHPVLRRQLMDEAPDEAAFARERDIREAHAEEIGEKGRMARKPGFVDEALGEMESRSTLGLRRGEGRLIAGRSQVPEPVKQWARAMARELHGEAAARAIVDIEQHTYLTQATVENLETLGVEFVEAVAESRRLPPEIDFSHDMTVAEYPEYAHKGEDVGHGATLGRRIGEIHGGEVSAPLELNAPRLNPPDEQFGLHVEFNPAHGGSLRESVRGVMRQSRDLAVTLERQAGILTERAAAAERVAAGKARNLRADAAAARTTRQAEVLSARAARIETRERSWRPRCGPSGCQDGSRAVASRGAAAPARGDRIGDAGTTPRSLAGQ